MIKHPHHFLLIIIVIAAAISSGTTLLHATNDGILLVAPSQKVTPGDSLKFSAVFNNAAGYPKGDHGFFLVTQEKGWGWISGKEDITMPEKGKSINIEFAKSFIFSKNAKPDTNYCFRLMLGGDNFVMKIPVSDIVCITRGSLQKKSSAESRTDNADNIKAIPGTMPDLTFNYVSIDKEDPTHAIVQILNKGDKDSVPCKLSIELSRLGKSYYSAAADIPSISKNSGVWIEIAAEKPLGRACDCTMQMCVDSTYIVIELDETNNCRQKSYATENTYDLN